MLDTLKYAEALRAAGVTEQQAAAHAEALKSAVQEGGLATKADIAELKTELKADIAELKAENRFQRWGISIIVAAVLAILWQLFALSNEVAALSETMERLAK